MKSIFYILLILSLSLFGCRKTDNYSLEYVKDIYQPIFSEGFEIKGAENSDNTLIRVFNPWQGAKGVASSFLIVRDSLNTGENYLSDLNYPGNIIYGTPDRIVCMSSTHIAMLQALDAVDKVVGVSGIQYISNPYIKENKDKIVDVGYEGHIDYEALVATKPDLVLLFSVNGASSMEPKLKELGIPFLYIGDYVEETPLGKTEWIIPIAEVLNIRNLGEKKFEEISGRYAEIRDKVENANFKRPLVMVNVPFTGTWFMPSTKSYVARMVEDAGGDYIYKKNTGNASRPINMEEAITLVNKSDYWINVGTLQTMNELINTFPRFQTANCVIEDKVYNNNRINSAGGGNDCYESGVVNPDLVLRDLVKIFHPELVKEDFVYYQKLK